MHDESFCGHAESQDGIPMRSPRAGEKASALELWPVTCILHSGPRLHWSGRMSERAYLEEASYQQLPAPMR
jgi:hypothetical protein